MVLSIFRNCKTSQKHHPRNRLSGFGSYATRSPIHQIMESACVGGSISVSHRSDQKETNYGKEAQKKDYCDLLKAVLLK